MKKSIIVYILFLCIILILSSCNSRIGDPDNQYSLKNETNNTNKNETDVNIIKEDSDAESTTFIQDEVSENNEIGIGYLNSDYCDHIVVSFHIPGGYVYDDSYHNVSGELINYIGYDNFAQWNDGITSDEDFNIINLIHDFNISQETFETILDNTYTGYFFDYNLDIIYSNNEKTIQDYYTSGMNRIGEILSKKYISFIKGSIISYLNDKYADEFDEWVTLKNNDDNWKYSELQYTDRLLYSIKDINGNPINLYSNIFTGNIRQWSIAEAVNYFNIPRSIIEEYNNIAYNSITSACKFDIDKLYLENSYKLISDELKDQTDCPSVDPILIDKTLISFEINEQINIWDNIMNQEY